MISQYRSLAGVCIDVKQCLQCHLSPDGVIHVHSIPFDAVNTLLLKLLHVQTITEDPKLHQAVFRCGLTLVIGELLSVEPFDELAKDLGADVSKNCCLERVTMHNTMAGGNKRRAIVVCEIAV